VVGLDTYPKVIDDFVHGTLLPAPRRIELQTEHVVKLTVRSRRVSKSIREIYDEVDASEEYCTTLTNNGLSKTFESDVAIMDVQQAVQAMVGDSKVDIFRQAASLSFDEQTICYAQAGASLSVKVKQFIEKANIFLPWNVTDTNDVRNHYLSCNHCCAVYVKVEGCDGNTTCGAIARKRDSTGAQCPTVLYFGIDWSLLGGRWTVITRNIERLWSRNAPVDLLGPCFTANARALSSTPDVETRSYFRKALPYPDVQLQEEVNKMSLVRDMEAEGLEFLDG
jgi:hypothetical protein